MNTFFRLLSYRLRHLCFPRYIYYTSLLAFTVKASPSYGQHTPCSTPYPEESEMAQVAAAMANAAKDVATTPLTWDIPVRVTVFQKNDGSGWLVPVDEPLVDGFLSSMNSKLAGGANIFHFFRCGPINYINSDQLYSHSVEPSDYSYNRNFLNLYLYNHPGEPPHSAYPWYPEPKAVYLTAGPLNLTNGDGLHELGHSLGLYHTFDQPAAYTLPVTPAQADYPNNPGGRELVLRDTNLSKPFPYPNASFAGDRVEDTPPGCDDTKPAQFYPSSATIAGCLDGDPNTPCLNGCVDGNPLTPCINGCTWDYSNCKYTGDYRDYNFDLLVDSANILATNMMSYTGACRTQFTPGQIARANDIENVYLNDYYEGELCGNLIDRVEIEGTSIGLPNVSIRITPNIDGSNYTQTVVNANGDFSGKLPNNNLSVQVGADVKRFRKTDITKYDNDWLKGLSTYDLVCINRHILGYDTLDGYKLVAADANNNDLVTSFDIVLFRRLILGIDTALAMYTQPWRFIPEVVTQAAFGGGLQGDFDGVGIDNPFHTLVPSSPGQYFAPSQYCAPNWQFAMRSGTVRNGFDAVKLGNICGTPSADVNDDCPGNVALVVPHTSISTGKKVTLQMKGYNFQSVAAFQMGLKVSAEDFEFVSAETTTLGNFSAEDVVGGLNRGKDDLKVVWISDNLAPKSITNGTALFTINLISKKSIVDLSQAITLDEKVLETYFITPDGGCKSNTSLEISANVQDRNSFTDDFDFTFTSKIHCIPNPASEIATILFDADRPFQGNISVYDVQGRLLDVIPYDFEAGRNVINLSDLSQFHSGILNIAIFDGKEIHSVRIIKE